MVCKENNVINFCIFCIWKCVLYFINQVFVRPPLLIERNTDSEEMLLVLGIYSVPSIWELIKMK